MVAHSSAVCTKLRIVVPEINDERVITLDLEPLPPSVALIIPFDCSFVVVVVLLPVPVCVYVCVSVNMRRT